MTSLKDKIHKCNQQNNLLSAGILYNWHFFTTCQSSMDIYQQILLSNAMLACTILGTKNARVIKRKVSCFMVHTI